MNVYTSKIVFSSYALCQKIYICKGKGLKNIRDATVVVILVSLKAIILITAIHIMWSCPIPSVLFMSLKKMHFVHGDVYHGVGCLALSLVFHQTGHCYLIGIP